MTQTVEPLVTIGIPTYNRASSTLPIALEAALNQTYQHLQIVVSDNCSGDDTETLVRGNSDPRICYLRQTKNIGANNNFNACVEHARGEYFLLLHDDDSIDSDFVESCIGALEHNAGVGLVRTGIRLIDGHGDSILEWENRLHGETLTDLISGWINSTTTMFCANTLIKTTALKEIGGFDSARNLFQDVLAHVKIAAAHGYTNVSDVKASFREHDQNQGKAARIEDWCIDSLELLATIEQLLGSTRQAPLIDQLKAFLCRINYGYARELPSLVTRFRYYRIVEKHFQGAFPMWTYYWGYDLLPRWRALKRRFKSSLPYRS